MTGPKYTSAVIIGYRRRACLNEELTWNQVIHLTSSGGMSASDNVADLTAKAYDIARKIPYGKVTTYGMPINPSMKALD